MKNNLENNPEFEALKEISGIDEKELLKQAGVEVETTPPVVDEVPPTPPAESGSPATTGQPPTEKPADQAPDQRGEFLKEIFGDRFKTVDDAKNANISGVFDEVENLRREKAELESKLSVKPKTNFANDEVALYNEFVRETGIQNYGVFHKINSSDLSTMEPMDALVTKYIFDHPEQASKESMIRKHFEKKYNVDPEEVDEDDLAINRIGMEADGVSAKKALLEVKGKIKVPEPETETDVAPKELTPEEKASLQTGWESVGTNVSKTLAHLQVPIKDGKNPLLAYEISEAEQKEIKDYISDYAVENRMELNEQNVKIVSTMIYNQLMLNKLPEIVHSVFEKARGMTEEQVHSLYENPSPAKNNDTPPAAAASSMTEREKQEEDIFQAEMGRYNK